MSRRLLAPLMTALCLLAAGCDQLGIESATALAARKEADGKAIGGACRHAGRAIEDCYTLNRRADRAAVYAGWREMNEYMRENKLESVAPQIPTETQLAAAAKAAEAEGSDEGVKHGEKSSDKPSEKAGDKGSAKADDKAAAEAPRKRRPAP